MAILYLDFFGDFWTFADAGGAFEPQQPMNLNAECNQSEEVRLQAARGTRERPGEVLFGRPGWEGHQKSHHIFTQQGFYRFADRIKMN